MAKSARISENGRFSPMWPTTTCSRGCRSNTPPKTIRSTCRPVSACQPHPAEPECHGRYRLQTAEIDVRDAFRRVGRVQVDRHSEPFDRRQQRLEFGRVEEAPRVCPLMMTPQKPSSSTARQRFRGSRCRIRRRHTRQRIEPRRMSPHGRGRVVVELPRERDGFGRNCLGRPVSWCSASTLPRAVCLSPGRPRQSTSEERSSR